MIVVKKNVAKATKLPKTSQEGLDLFERTNHLNRGARPFKRLKTTKKTESARFMNGCGTTWRE